MTACSMGAMCCKQTPCIYHSGNPADAAEVDALRARVERLETALRGLVADVADYPAWQRPCLALDTARAALEPQP